MTVVHHRRTPRGIAAAALVAVALAAPNLQAAPPPTLPECIAANERAIQMRADHKLLASRDQSLVCAAASCPGAVRDVCQKRVTDLTSAIPSLVFEVKDAAGRDLAAVVVTVDGQLLVDHVDGSPVAVDPGEHTFAFQAAGQPRVDKHIVVYEGDKGRHEAVAIGAAPSVPPSNGPIPARELPATPPTGEPSSGLTGTRVTGLVLGGVGVAGVAVGAVFGVLTMSKWSSVKDACGPGGPSRCAATDPSAVTSDKNAAHSDGTLSTVAFIAGGVLVAAGATLFLLGGRSEAGAAPSASVSLAPAVGPGLAALGLQGAF
jgi:hypothetical protein